MSTIIKKIKNTEKQLYKKKGGKTQKWNKSLSSLRCIKTFWNLEYSTCIRKCYVFIVSSMGLKLTSIK